MIQTALEWSGCIVIRVQSGTIFVGKRAVKCAEKGTPDLCVMAPGGRTIWLEVKTKAGVVSAAQEAMHSRMRSLGHSVFVARSVNDARVFCLGG
jgi:hypothetical protein